MGRALFQAPHPLPQPGRWRRIGGGERRQIREAERGMSKAEAIEEAYLAACARFGARPDGGFIVCIRMRLAVFKVTAKISEHDFLPICDVLPQCTWIEKLDLSMCEIASNGCYMLVPTLQSSECSIRRLDLRSNKIGPRGASALAEGLKKNRSVERINLRGNRIYLWEELLGGRTRESLTRQQKGSLALAGVFESSKTLKKVNLSNSHLGFTGTRAVERAFAANSHKIEFDVCKKALPEFNKKYPPQIEDNNVFEEIMNSVTHLIGLIGAIIGTICMFWHFGGRSTHHLISVILYGGSMIMVYSSSLFMHSLFKIKCAKRIFQRLDHCSIFFLIAGTYTPFFIINCSPDLGTTCLVVWVLAVVGALLDMLAPPRLMWIVVIIYVSMGWCCLSFVREVFYCVDWGGVVLLFLGGFVYTAGIYFFFTGRKEKPLNHAIWHVFVMGGSLFHFFAVVLYSMPLEVCMDLVDKTGVL